MREETGALAASEGVGLTAQGARGGPSGAHLVDRHGLEGRISASHTKHRIRFALESSNKMKSSSNAEIEKEDQIILLLNTEVYVKPSEKGWHVEGKRDEQRDRSGEEKRKIKDAGIWRARNSFEECADSRVVARG